MMTLKEELLKQPTNVQPAESAYGLMPELQAAPDVNGQTPAVLLKEYERSFSERDIESIQTIANSIELLDNDSLITYGANAQEALGEFSHTMLEQVQTKDIAPVGKSLESLMQRLKRANPAELDMTNKNIFQKMIFKVRHSVQDIIDKHQKITVEVDNIATQLTQAQALLTHDVNHLDTLYAKNKEYFDAVNVYIAAAELKRAEIETEILPALESKAGASNNQMVTQDVNDMVQYANRLEKRTHDLKLSRQITLQSAPQIRMIQNINQTLAEKIQSSVLTSIPIWKNQMAIALTLNKQADAAKAQKAVTDTTNSMLEKNSQMLKQTALVAAVENERGIVDVDTLRTTQENLVSTIEETLRIQRDGTTKRREAEKELVKMESDLKQRLLQIRENNSSN